MDPALSPSKLPFVLGFFGLMAVLSIVIGAPAQLAGVGPGLIFTEIFVFLAPSILLAHRLGIPARVLTRAGPVPWRLVALGALIGLVNYPIAIALEAAMTRLLPDALKGPDIGGVLNGVSGFSRVLLVLGVGVLAPLGEETAFRGVIQRLLRPRLGAERAVALTAVLFSAIHFDLVGSLGRAELGALFGVMALWSGSLWVGMAAHASNNLIAVALFYGVGGRSDSDLPGIPQLLGLAVVGLLLVSPLLGLMRRWTQGAESPAELPEIRPTRIQGELAKWAGAMVLVMVALVGVDGRAFHLSLTDATTPYQQGFVEGTPHAEIDRELRDLHREAESGAISTKAYDDFRHWLFRGAQDKQLVPAEIESRIRDLRAAPPP